MMNVAEEKETGNGPTADDLVDCSRGVTRKESDSKVSKSLPNGCLKHLEENGLVKLDISAEKGAEQGGAGLDSGDPDDEVTRTRNHPSEADANDDNVCDTEDASSVSHNDCDLDHADTDGELTGSSDSATNSVSTAISRVSLSDAESSRADSDPKAQQKPLTYVVYESEEQMPDIMRLITKDLSEPYSIYTYRYFIHNWPKLCFLAMDEDACVGAIVCKLDLHKKMVRRGYIAMLAVDENYRRRGIGSHLVMKAIRAMVTDDCDEVVLETEITNKAALKLYENLGFVRDKRLFRYYLNGVDALRLKLWLR